MSEWILNITYKLKPYKLKAAVEYHSSQIMRIRVYGMKQSLLLENDYPIISAGRGKRGMHWKIKEGQMTEASPESARLLLNIFEQLEDYIKADFPPPFL